MTKMVVTFEERDEESMAVGVTIEQGAYPSAHEAEFAYKSAVILETLLQGGQLGKDLASFLSK